MTAVDPDDLAPTPSPTDADLRRVADLVAEQAEAEAEVLRLTAELETAIERLRGVSDRALPEAMAAVHLSKFALADGTGVKVEDRYFAGKLTSREGLDWVLANGSASAIDTVVTVALDREDRDVALDLLKRLREHPAANRFKTLDLEESVNSQRLAALVKRAVAAGRNPPLEALGAYRRVRAVIDDRKFKTVELKGLKA
jgi:hypothetical protein